MKRKLHKRLSLLLAFVMVFTLSINIMQNVGALTETLAEWTLTGALDGNQGTAADGGGKKSESYLFSTAAYSGFTPNNGTVYYNTWSVGGYWEITTSTVGYENLELAFASYGSNTGPKNFAIYMSVDGGVFTKVLGSEYSLTTVATSGTNRNIIVALPQAAENALNLRIRMQVEDGESVNGGTIATAGTSRIGSVILTGTGISGSGMTKAASPTANPPTGATISDGDAITLSTATSGAQMYYTVDGSLPSTASTTYTTPISVDFGTQTILTISAISVAAGYDNSDVAVFIYNKPNAPLAIPVAQAITAQSGSQVTVQGVLVYNSRNGGGTSDNGVYLQDNSGAGINIRPGSGSYNSTDIRNLIGQEVKITGEINVYNGLVQLQNRIGSNPQLFEIEIVDPTPSLPTPIPVTVADILANNHPFMMVALENARLLSKDDTWTSGHSNYTIEQNGQVVRLYAPANLINVQPGDWITITKGISTQNNGPQIYVNSDSAADIILGTPLPQPVLPDVDGAGDIARWIIAGISGTVTEIGATSGDYMAESILQFIKDTHTPQNINFASGGANISGLNGSANSAWWSIETCSSGFANIEVSWNMRSSATGPRDFKLQFSTDGSTWIDGNNPDVALPSAVAIGNTNFIKTLPMEANNQSTLYLRFIQTSDIAANGATVGSGGTHQINNIIINGEYILGADQLRRPQADIGSGAIPIGQMIAFSPGSIDDEALPGYEMLVSADGGFTWSAAMDSNYTITTLPLTILVKAIAPRKADSRIAEYSYIHGKLPMVTSSRNSGAIIPGATIKLENTIQNAIIKYTINGGVEQIYSDALILEETFFIGDPATMTIDAWAEGNGYITGDITTFIYTVSVTGGEQVYFGQIHSHTTNSDGIGSLAEAYDYAKYVAELDFFAVTDHSNSFDETGATSDNPLDINLETYNANSAKWQAGIAAANAALSSDFISIYGYEMTWSGGPGHINTYNTGGFVSRNNSALNAKGNDAGMRAYYELLSRTPNSVSMFNHPGTTFGNFANFAYYDPVIDQRISLIEVGNGEGALGSGGYFRSYEQYTLALDKGWHLAPTNNQDNHLGLWGDSNTARTAIWTNDLSVEGLYQAMRDMRVYATEVADLEIVYKVNGQPLGSVLDIVPPSANFTAEIVNPTIHNTIKSVSLITNGGVEILKDMPDTQNYNYNKTLNNPLPGYYYLRVVVSTIDGDRIAVTAPVWLGQGKAAGFVEVKKSAVMPVTGEGMTLEACLFNNESQAATLLSLEYKDNNGIILAYYDSLNLTIPPTSEVTHSYTYAPTVAGNTTVTATALLRFADGSELSYSYNISYAVWDADSLVYLGIDASHYNEYVDGNYKDNMINFAAIAAEHGVRVNILWTSQELIDACMNEKYKALILTAPSRRIDPVAMNPSTGLVYGDHKSYSQMELDAIALFARSGGTLVLTGWSNVYESYSYTATMQLSEHMAAQQNMVLAALGSTLRLSDDAATDSMQWSTASDQFRLYLSETYGSYNWASSLLDGVDASQMFSQYGGSTIYTVDQENRFSWDAAPSLAVPGSVVPAIMLSLQGESINRETAPSGTNYRTDYTKFNDRFILLASEIVDHGNGATSLIIAAGGAFMSNFEVKIEMENSATLQYSNYNVALNLILSIAPEQIVTSIEHAKMLPAGTIATIEGVASSNVYTGNSAINTGFFDCIYVQDATGGINLFPVSSGILEGQTIRVTGALSAYQGETQMAVTKIAVIDESIDSAVPTAMTTAQAMAPANTGLLLNVTGIVSDVIKTGEIISQFTVTDASGTGALVFINAYITNTVDLSFLEEGAEVNVTGLASIGENYASSNHLPRIRVRDRKEIVLIAPPLPATYQITFDANGGTVSPEDAMTETDGKLFNLPIPTRSGRYSFDGWYDSPTGGTAISSETVFSSSTTIYAQWTYTGGSGGGYDSRPGTQAPQITEPDIPLVDKPWPVFDDVSEGEWYYQAVKYVYDMELMIGVADDSFGIESTLTRAMIVTILYRCAGEPSIVETASLFVDVADDMWYTEAIIWGVENGIIFGYGDGRFGPNNPVTNEQLAALIYRMQLRENKVPPDANDDAAKEFLDKYAIREYAVIAVETLYRQGMYNDMPMEQYSPGHPATRAAIASILYKYLMAVDSM